MDLLFHRRGVIGRNQDLPGVEGAELLQNRSDHERIRTLDRLRQTQGRLDEAVELFQATIRINPQDEAASRRLQMALQQRRDAASD